MMPAAVDVVSTVSLPMPVLAMVDAGVLRAAVGLVGLAAHLVQLGVPSVLAVPLKQVSSPAAVSDDGPVA